MTTINCNAAYVAQTRLLDFTAQWENTLKGTETNEDSKKTQSTGPEVKQEKQDLNDGTSAGEWDRRDRDNLPTEFKSFRIQINSSCRDVLPTALIRYKIENDWRLYALYIVCGDQERCLALEEKPLLLYRRLRWEGRKPMFMLRRRALPLED